MMGRIQVFNGNLILVKVPLYAVGVVIKSDAKCQTGN